MARRKKDVATGQEITQQPKSLSIAATGITTGQDFAACMSALMSDLLSAKVTPGIANAVCNAGGKLLKVVEMQFKYGTMQPSSGTKLLVLAVPGGAEVESKAQEVPTVQ